MWGKKHKNLGKFALKGGHGVFFGLFRGIYANLVILLAGAAKIEI